jgi:hypothetical protein
VGAPVNPLPRSHTTNFAHGFETFVDFVWDPSATRGGGRSMLRALGYLE